ncbi:MAG: M36 family metallopeptidase [Bryobacteraceae bacterium]
MPKAQVRRAPLPASIKAKVETHATHGTPRRIFDIESKPSKARPEKIARELLRKLAPSLGIDPKLSGLRLDKVKETILGHHVFFQQEHAGLPVTGCWVKVDIDKQGRPFHVLNTLVPGEVQKKAAVRAVEISEEAAREKALAALGKAGSMKVLEQEKVTFPHEGSLVPAWKLVVQTTKPTREMRIYVDGASGEILHQYNQLKEAQGQGRVFDPNPVVTLNDTSLEDSSVIPDGAYIDVTLRDLKPGGRLDGPFVSTANTPSRVKSTSGKFLFKRNNNGFKEVMVYFHIDRVQRYIQQLGFDNVLNKPIKVNVMGPLNEDNSFYSPSTKALQFGRGGVDDAEDAEIILHEYGHAVQDDQVPGFGASHEAGSMGEGFGDYLAASFFAETKPEKLRPCVGSWDAVAYSADDPPSLRRLDSNKKYPKDMTNEVHDDGEIWSACLWEIRLKLGRQATDKLVIAHHFQISRDAGFEDAANALVTVDGVLNEGRNQAVIRDVFVRRGILQNAKRGNRRAGQRFEDTQPR